MSALSVDRFLTREEPPMNQHEPLSAQQGKGPTEKARPPVDKARYLRLSIFRCAHLTAHPCAPCNTSGTRPRRPVGRWLCNIDNIERQRGIIFTSSVHTTAERASEDRAVMHHALGHLSELHLCGWRARLERIHQVMCLPECLRFSMQDQALSKLKVRSRSVPVDFHCSSHGPTRTSDGLDMIRVFYGRFPEHRKTISVCSLWRMVEVV